MVSPALYWNSVTEFTVTMNSSVISQQKCFNTSINEYVVLILFFFYIFSRNANSFQCCLSCWFECATYSRTQHIALFSPPLYPVDTCYKNKFHEGLNSFSQLTEIIDARKGGKHISKQFHKEQSIWCFILRKCVATIQIFLLFIYKTYWPNQFEEGENQVSCKLQNMMRCSALCMSSKSKKLP